jgi:hypothetical protein
MRRWAILVLFAMAGCSTAPLADFLDAVRPAHFRPDAEDPGAPVATPPPGGAFLPPQGVAPTAPPALPPFQPLPPNDGTSPGPLRVPNT